MLVVFWWSVFFGVCEWLIQDQLRLLRALWMR